MSAQTIVKLCTAPSRLSWWEWCQIGGCVALAVLVGLLAAGCALHPAVIAVLLHVACDFTCQSPTTAARKPERGRHLLTHALAAGSVPLAFAGLATGNPLRVLVYAAAGFLGHYAVDWARKFGIQKWLPAILADQSAHLLLILALTVVLGK
jgi:hypothetical protein